MIRFTTISGSCYEVDQENKLIRRLSGRNSPTHRQGKEGEYRKYAGISSIVVGNPVLIKWLSDTPLLPGSPEQAIPATMTSQVEEILSGLPYR
jgi:hypothetical protein